MKLTIRNCDDLGDWYVIERAEHDGRSWIGTRDLPGYGPIQSLHCSSRFSDADVEGTAAEMLAIADAIERRAYVSFRRCAVYADREPVRFRSPRNSIDDGECTYAEAAELAALIRKTITKPEATETGS